MSSTSLQQKPNHHCLLDNRYQCRIKSSTRYRRKKNSSHDRDFLPVDPRPQHSRQHNRKVSLCNTIRVPFYIPLDDFSMDTYNCHMICSDTQRFLQASMVSSPQQRKRDQSLLPRWLKKRWRLSKLPPATDLEGENQYQLQFWERN